MALLIIHLLLCFAICPNLSLSSFKPAPACHDCNLATVQQIYDLSVYPANAELIVKGSAGVPKGLFSESVIGIDYLKLHK